MLEPSFPQPVGQCIYCRRTPNSLRREHIIPLGLNGEWVLDRASCKECADITSRLELSLLRGELLPLRTKLALRTRRKKERPVTLPFKYRSAGRTESADLHIGDHPGAVALPIFGEPGHASTGDSTLKVVRIGLLRPEASAFEFVRKTLGADHFTARWPEPAAFARLIAKVAYGFAVGCVGLDSIRQPYVVPAILGEVEDVGRWVGTPNMYGKTDVSGLHAVTLEQRGQELWAYVRLFAQFEAPEYCVIVGSLAVA
jgi:hypothetical protein